MHSARFRYNSASASPGHPGRTGWRRLAVGGVLLALLALAGACQQGTDRIAIPTGVETNELPDGRTEFLATARASAEAIASGHFVKKQNTSCPAAKLLLENEFYTRSLGQVNYSKAEFQLIYDAEYCRIRIIR